MKSEMKRVKNVSSQFCREPSLGMVGEGRGLVHNSKFFQNGLKHILVLEFLKSDEVLKIGIFLIVYTQPTNRADGHHSDQIYLFIYRPEAKLGFNIGMVTANDF